MPYKAIVVKPTITKHPNANKLWILNANGYQIIQGVEPSEGELYVFFPEGGTLCHELVSHTNGYKAGAGVNKDPDAIGFFEANRRIRTIKLRGEISEGYSIPLKALSFLGEISHFKEGDLIDRIGDTIICEKYYSKATQSMKEKDTSDPKLPRISEKVFPKHFDTEQLRTRIKHLEGISADIWITEKLHGTSGRTGNLRVKTPTWFQRTVMSLLLCLAATTGIKWFTITLDRMINRLVYDHVTGTRNTVHNINADRDTYRTMIHYAILAKGGLPQDTVIYYEITGARDNGMPLFQHHIPDDEVGKELKKKYGKTMKYLYDTPVDNSFWVYRVVQNGKELSWPKVQDFCNSYGFKTPPFLAFIGTNKLDSNDLLKNCSYLSSGPSSVDPTHIKEGVCVRIEPNDDSRKIEILKYKGFEFCHLEGITKNEDYIDLEEIS